MSKGSGSWTPSICRFPDASFDVVVAQYVVTTVPNPEATLDEFARVLKPGGEIVLVSRVGAEAGLRRALEHGSRRRRASSAGARSSRSSAMRAGPSERRHGADRAPRDAAVRALLADPIHQNRRGATPAGTNAGRAAHRRRLIVFFWHAAFLIAACSISVTSHSSNRHSKETATCSTRERYYARLSGGAARAALGRSSLLSSQPDQPVAPSGERAQLPVRLCR